MEKDSNVSIYNQSVSEDSTLSKRDKRKERRKRINESKKYTGFQSFRAKDAIIRAIKAFMIGIAVALFVGGVYTIATNVIPLKLYMLHYLVIVLVYILLALALVAVMALAFVPIFVITFFGLRRGDKTFAKSIDKQFYLKESMQTMLENAANDSEMARLQREGLREKVKGLRHRRLRLERLYIYIIALLLSTVFIFGTFVWGICCIPKRVIKPESEPEQVTPFKLTEMQEAQLRAIEARVRRSDMESPAREQVADEVLALTNALKVTEDFDIAASLVELSTEKIDMITEKTGTSYELHDILIEDDTPFVREMARLLTKLELERFEQKRETIRASFEHIEYGTENADIAKITNDTIILFRENAEELKNALEGSGIDPADPLYATLLQVSIDLDTLANDLEAGNINYRNAVGREGNGELLTVLSDDIYRELDKQNVSYSVGFSASDEIRKMFPEFNLQIPQREDNSQESSESDDEDDKKDEEEKDTDGGAGDGDIFGSDDIVYDKDAGSVKYGEVLDKYYQIMNDASYTEEEKKIIREYFEILFRGLEDEER